MSCVECCIALLLTELKGSSTLCSIWLKKIEPISCLFIFILIFFKNILMKKRDEKKLS